MVINTQLTGNDVVLKQQWLDLTYHTGISLQRPRKPHEKHVKISSLKF